MSDQGSEFQGADYDADLDAARLGRQIRRVASAMSDGAWRTLSEIEAITGDPQASISAQLRNLRKARHGTSSIERRRRGDRRDGLFEYRLELSPAAKAAMNVTSKGGVL
jgi:hypothetical protein